VKFIPIFLALFTFVAGQLLFKHAMEASEQFGFGDKFLRRLVPGICSMTVSFFVTLGLLQHLDLSYVYPFQGLSVIMISLLAVVLLKEKFDWQLTLGALLISGGVALVSVS
jgi:drug/metabolite transporter (DMT)-like permease